ncbi:MAG: N-acetyltransferase [Anaerolineaceae bacterium]|jgi:ribosomal-protein-alanine N-acetyltransferase|nr:N-acetyltransferase [Anaerolineaceae bacterium]
MISIETASIKDLNSLRQLEKICFPIDNWPLLDLIGVLTMPGVVRFKATFIDNFIGFIAGSIKTRNSVGWITTIAVLPEYQNRGIAQQLLQECENKMKVEKILLTVRKSNSRAIRLYEKNGYFIHEIWKSYYIDGEDAILFQKRVDNYFKHSYD